MYPNLKLQLWRSGIRQNRLAQLLGIHETMLSKIVNGFRAPDAQLRSQIAALLQSDEEWLFAGDAGAPRDGGSAPDGVRLEEHISPKAAS
jgi:transcriptional regulator with XRE-family HTH domain